MSFLLSESHYLAVTALYMISQNSSSGARCIEGEKQEHHCLVLYEIRLSAQKIQILELVYSLFEKQGFRTQNLHEKLQ